MPREKDAANPKLNPIANTLKWVKNFFGKYYNIFIGLKLSAVSLCLFLILDYPDLFLNISGFRQRWYGLAVIVFYLLASTVLTFFTRWTFKRKLNVWAQSNILFGFSVVYYLRLSSETFNLFGGMIDSGLVLIPLSILILAVNRRLFSRTFLREYLLILEVALFALTTFSVVSLLNIRTLIEAQNGLLDGFLSVPDIVWIVIGATSVGIITAFNIGVRKTREVGLWFGGFLTFSLQSMWLLSYLNLSYWYKALVFLIFWDYIYNSSRAIAHHESELNFYAKLSISTIYHILLMGVVLYFGTLYI